MGRKSLWKEFHPSTSEYRHLRSYWDSNSRGAWKNWECVFDGGNHFLETNLPYNELRLWWRFALGKPLPDHVSSDIPSWELYKDEEEKDN